MKMKIRLLYKLALIVLLFAAGGIIASGLFPAIAFLFPQGKARLYRDKIKIIWLKGFCTIVCLRIDMEGKASNRPVLVACNHVSWLDILVLGQYLPGCFVAKSDISNWPVIGFLSRQAGTVFIRRGDKKQIMETAEKMVWLLKQNSNIMSFPEGTTTPGEDVLPFHASLFQPAVLTKSPVQPAAIRYLGAAKQKAPYIGDDVFALHLIQMLMLDKIDVRLSFLPLIDTVGKSRNAVSAEARQVIIEAISVNDPEEDLTTNYFYNTKMQLK